MAGKVEKVLVPDIGGAKDVTVIEIAVKPGDKVSVDDPLITLEGEKASIDVPSPFAGEIAEIKVKVGDKVSEGSVILSMKTEAASEEVEEKGDAEKEKTTKKTEEEPKKETKKKEKEEPEKETQKAAKKETKTTTKEKETEQPEKKREEVAEKGEEEGAGKDEEAEEEAEQEDLHAGPGVRRIAREFGIDLNKVVGTGPKQRILKEDLQQFVKQQLKIAEVGTGSGLQIAPMPKIDFTKFGEIEKKPVSKIKKSSGTNLHRNWVSIPHITQFDEADITDMESFRIKHQEEAQKRGFKLTPLVFIMKAVVSALKQYPIFNSSLDETGENLILKKFFHVGVAVDTPNGLVVPVIRNVDKKGLFDLAKELFEISAKAREKGLSLTDMQGGCFSISSLGGIGGTAFTPIVNAPEVAILGISKASTKLIHQRNGEFEPRLMLPLSLSYDHRVVDGADGARFITYLSRCLSDIGSLIL